jgi:hypothetical protein
MFREINTQSPHDIGSYKGGLVSDVQVGITPSTQLKFNPLTIRQKFLDRNSKSHTEEERH